MFLWQQKFFQQIPFCFSLPLVRLGGRKSNGHFLNSLLNHLRKNIYLCKVNMMNNLYIIAGPNGAGKTTASFTVLPDMLNCKEFVNADEIARGISPFYPESAAIDAGRIFLKRIQELLKLNKDFAFETTLSTRSYVNFM